MTASNERRAGVIAVALAVLGVAVLRIGFAPFDQRAGWLAVLAMWIVGASGLLAWLRAPGSRVGPLLTIAAGASGIGALAAGAVSGPGIAVDMLLAGLGWPVLGHAILTTPTGRIGDRRSAVAVAALYVTFVLPPDISGIARSAVVVAGVGALALRGASPSRATLAATAAYLVGTTGLAAIVPGPGPGADPRIVAGVAAATIGVLLAGDIVAVAGRRRRILDFIVDLDGSPTSRTVTPRLEALLARPGLRIAYRLPDGRFVDADGVEMEPDERAPGGPSAHTSTTPLDHGGVTVALVRHRPGALADPGVRQALARAASLVVAHRHLQEDVAAQVVEVEASRRRIIQAADEENLQLRLELEQRLGPRLDALEAALHAIPVERVTARISHAGAEIRAARREMDAILDGLPPRELDRMGLPAALAALAARSPLPARATLAGEGPDDGAARTALYFSCSEGITNATRHAGATRVTIELACDDDACVLEVADDGLGGARAGPGTGLVGIQDRLEAVGGRLDIHSPAGGGTRLIARVPRGVPVPTTR